MRLRDIVAPVGGALTWVGLVWARLRSVDESLWIARDDAVITLSHARNAAEFGSIGVSPGDRVEGFSSPLHFAIAYATELVSNAGYRTLTIVILVLMSALAGALVAGALHAIARSSGIAEPAQPLVAIGLTAAAAAYSVASWTSVGWIGSGMENPVVVCSGMAVAFFALTPRWTVASQQLLVLSVACFMISRVELAAFSAPALFAASWMHSSKAQAGKQLRSFVQTVAAALLLVALVHLARRWYFGDWLPNTAVVQGRSTGFPQLVVIGLMTLIALIATAIAFAQTNPTAISRRGIVTDLRILGGSALAGLALMSATGRSGAGLGDLLLLRPLLPLIILIAVLLLAQRSTSAKPWIPNHVFAGIAMVPLAQFVAMGSARLDAFRVAVIALPFLAVWAVALGLHVVSLRRSAATAPRGLAGLTPRLLGGLIVVAMIAGIGFTASDDRARRLNWEISSAPVLIDVVNTVRERHFDGGLALTANPDLGKVSYEKGSVITDLALLGDPLVTKIAEARPDLVTTFMHFVARPDVLEAHGVWACTYNAWLTSPQFAAGYTFSDERWDDGRTDVDDCGFNGLWVIWVRTDAADEYQLTRDLLASPDPASIAQAALDQCAAVPDGVLRCQGLRRSIQRASASLRAGGTFDATVAVMEASPSASFDVPMLRRGSGWASDAAASFIKLIDG